MGKVQDTARSWAFLGLQTAYDEPVSSTLGGRPGPEATVEPLWLVQCWGPTMEPLGCKVQSSLLWSICEGSMRVKTFFKMQL